MKCWNCLSENGPKAHRCGQCDQAVRPNAAQRVAGKRHVDYLLQEMEAWTFLADEAKDELRAVYLARLERLKDISSKTAAQWPESDWPTEAPEIPRAQPLRAKEEQTQQESSEEELEEETKAELEVETETTTQGDTEAESETEAEPELEKPEEPTPTTETASEAPFDEEAEILALPAPPSKPHLDIQQALPEEAFQTLGESQESQRQSYLDSLVGEADIRWFHSLGAILVVAAVIGWLRASWTSYGKALTGVLITSSPFLLHYISHKLKKSVPLSARLLSTLAAILTPPALLAVDIFGGLPAAVPSKLYWTFALLVSAALLSWQASQTHEKVPLYLGALCAISAGWPQGALATALCSLGLGFLFAKDSDSGDPEWERQRQQVSFYGGSFGALATLLLFDTSNHPSLPLAAFSAALIFLHFPTLTGQSKTTSGGRLFLQASLTIVGSILMRAVLGLSPGGVGLYLLFAAALFLTVKSDSQIAAGTVKLASGIGFLGLFIAFMSDLGAAFTAQQTGAEAALRFAFALASTVFFGRASRKRDKATDAQAFFLVALLSVFGGWFHLFLFVVTGAPLSGPGDLLPLVACLPIFCFLALGASRLLLESERRVLWVFVFLVSLAGLFFSVFGRLVTTNGEIWTIVVGLHGLLYLIWERGWLCPHLSDTTVLLGQFQSILPRLTTIAFTLTFFAADLIRPGKFAVATVLATHIALSYLLKGNYRKASWELAWFFSWSVLLLTASPAWLAPVPLATLLLAPALPQRKSLSLLGSTAIAACVFFEIWADMPLAYYFLVPAAWAVAAALPARDESPWKDIGKTRYGFDILLALAVFVGERLEGGSVSSLTFCLCLVALGVGFHKFKDHKVAQRVLSEQSPAALGIILLVWSFAQSSLETGLLFTIMGIAVAALTEHKHKTELSSGLLIMGVAQIASPTHFVFDPLVLAGGIIISELVTLVRNRPSAHISNLSLLIVATVQGQAGLLPEFTSTALLVAALAIALRAIQLDQYTVALIGTTLFLGRVNELIDSSGVDFKLRLLPTAFCLVGVALWKWSEERPWTKGAFQLGLGLAVAPAFLQFAGGLSLLENFAWLLIGGSAYVGLSFVSPAHLSRILRQAGGYTLTGWAAVSLTRAAMKLPWQAATLVIGVALVGVGVYVEKKRKG